MKTSDPNLDLFPHHLFERLLLKMIMTHAFTHTNSSPDFVLYHMSLILLLFVFICYLISILILTSRHRTFLHGLDIHLGEVLY